MVDGIKGSTEVERDKESRFVIVGRVVNMIKSTKEDLFQWSDCGGFKLGDARMWG